MRPSRLVFRSSSVCLVFLSLAVPSLAQIHPQPRVTQAVDNAQRVTLPGNVHPLARPEFDRGVVSDAQPMTRILILLKRGDEQEVALQDTLDKQQDKSSPMYHQWLTPDQFGAQFGVADADIARSPLNTAATRIILVQRRPAL